jgi:hypothetical protein
MTSTLTAADLQEAAAHLSRTERGRSAMRYMLAWLNDDGLCLDCDNQFACLTLLEGAWGSYRGNGA